MTMTLDMFQDSQDVNEPEKIDLHGADILYWHRFFSSEDSILWFEKIQSSIVWQQKNIVMYGKSVAIPRLSAWYADSGKNYTYSGELHEATSWTAELLELKTELERRTGQKFNSVLCNLYRDGQDSVAWHSDDEKELGENPSIASLSFGQERIFQFRKASDHKLKFNLSLCSGSCLLMKGQTQKNWQHQIAKSTKQMQARINLTFRYVY